MRSIKGLFGLVVALLASVSAPVYAQRADSGTKRAVLVGVNAYAAEFNPLNFAASDARTFRDTLVNASVGGYSAAETALLTTDSAEPTLLPSSANIKRAVEQLAQKTRPGDTALFYFSGHGVPMDGKSCLVPMDASIDTLAERVISTRYIRDLFKEKSRDCNIILVFDACYSGSPRDLVAVPKLEAVFDGKNMVTITSCSANQRAWEFPELKQGVFTYYLMRALCGEADSNKDSSVTAKEVVGYVKPRVEEHVQRMMQIKQEPQFFLAEASEMVMSRVNGDALNKLQVALYNQKLDSKKPLGPALVIVPTLINQGRGNDALAIKQSKVRLTKEMLKRSYPVLDENAAQELAKFQDPEVLKAEAQKKGVRYVLKLGLALETDRVLINGRQRFVSTVTLTAELFDASGNVHESVSGDGRANALIEQNATNDAVEEAVGNLVKNLETKLKQLMEKS